MQNLSTIEQEDSEEETKDEDNNHCLQFAELQEAYKSHTYTKHQSNSFSTDNHTKTNQINVTLNTFPSTVIWPCIEDPIDLPNQLKLLSTRVGILVVGGCY